MNSPHKATGIYSNEAEVACLGAMIESEKATNLVLTRIDHSDFYDARHKDIFSVIKNLSNDKIPVDVVTVSEKLDSLGLLSMIGGAEYIASLVENVAAVSNVKYYSDIIKEKSNLRGILDFSRKISEGICVQNLSSDAILEMLSEEMVKHTTERMGGFTDMKSATQNTLKRIDDIQSGKIKPIQTADYPHFNDLFWIEPGDLNIIGGLPASGKTLFSFELCKSFARNGHKCLYLSLEMTNVALTSRLASFEAKVSMKKIIRAELNDYELNKIVDACDHIRNYPIVIDDQPAINVDQMYQKILAGAAQGCDVVFLDHAHQMRPRDGQIADRFFYKEISNKILQALKETGMAGFVLVQLNKSAHGKKDGPDAGDIRESGEFNQDAHNVWMISKEKVEDPNLYGSDFTRQIEMKIRSWKARNGTLEEYKMIADFGAGRIAEVKPHGKEMNNL